MRNYIFPLHVLTFSVAGADLRKTDTLACIAIDFSIECLILDILKIFNKKFKKSSSV